MSRLSVPAVCAALLAGCAGTHGDVTRFEAALGAQDSATRVLSERCAARLAPDAARVTAAPVSGPAVREPETLRQQLGVGPDEPLGFRHVRLACGGAVLSEAYNWYLPSRLAPEMNRALATSDTPFGTVAAPLGFRRERLALQRGRAAPCPAGTVLSHRAMLRLPDGRSLAWLVECYTRANL